MAELKSKKQLLNLVEGNDFDEKMKYLKINLDKS